MPDLPQWHAIFTIDPASKYNSDVGDVIRLSLKLEFSELLIVDPFEMMGKLSTAATKLTDSTLRIVATVLPATVLEF